MRAYARTHARAQPFSIEPSSEALGLRASASYYRELHSRRVTHGELSKAIARTIATVHRQSYQALHLSRSARFGPARPSFRSRSAVFGLLRARLPRICGVTLCDVYARVGRAGLLCTIRAFLMANFQQFFNAYVNRHDVRGGSRTSEGGGSENYEELHAVLGTCVRTGDTSIEKLCCRIKHRMNKING